MKEQSEDVLKSWSKFAKVYDPIKCGSIDGIDCEPHDRAVIRAINNEYRPNKFVKGNPERTIFISRLSHETSKDTIKEIFSKYGQLKRFRMVKDIVTGMSKGYAFVEYEEEQAAEEAYRLANKMVVDGSAIFVDFECERLLKGWKPRRLGGGFGGKKESGQLRFGGRDRPFKKPIALELKEQDERRQRERDRRAKEDERRRREKSRDRRRRSPVRDTRVHSQSDKKKESNKRSKSPFNANSSEIKKATTGSKPPLNENLLHPNGKDQRTPKDVERSNLSDGSKPRVETSKPATNEEKEKPKSPVRDSQRSGRRSAERGRKSKGNKRRSVSKDKTTKTTKVQSPVRKISRERRENQKAVSPVSSRGRSSPRNKPSKTAQPPVTPLERSSRRSPPRSPAGPSSSKRSKYSRETDNVRLWSPLPRNREFSNRHLERERHRSRSPLNVQESVFTHSNRPDSSSLDYLPLDRREVQRSRFPPGERYRDFEHEDNSYRHEDIPSSYREGSPLENDRALWSPSYGRSGNNSSYEYRRQSPYNRQAPADYMDTRYENHPRDTYNDAESHFDEYSTHRADEYQSPLKERSIERVYSDHNDRNSYSEQTYSDYDRYRNSYDNYQMREDYGRNQRIYPHQRDEIGRRDMQWNNQISRSSVGQVESNYQSRSERVSREDLRNRSNILHLKKVASSFRR